MGRQVLSGLTQVGQLGKDMGEGGVGLLDGLRIDGGDADGGGGGGCG